MPPRVVGLDIGSHAVRAAAVRLGDPPRLDAFGQVGLPRGAVEHGEVVEPATVASAIRRLFREARIRDRRVRVGVASLRTIVRQVEMPDMEEDELRSAIEFQAADFIPLPAEETVLDFRVLESFESDEGEPMLRVLLAAIHRDALERTLIAVREAGLQAVAVDLVPFALVRALSRPAPPPPPPPPAPPEEPGAPGEPGPGTGEPEPPGEAGSEPPGPPEPPEPPEPPAPPAADAEAIVSVGSGVTVVVVHEDGVPRFVRIVDSGGDELTDAIAEALGIEVEEAEGLKRRLDDPAAERRDEALSAMDGRLDALVNEIRGSIDFYASQIRGRPVGQVVVTGGGSLVADFAERVADALGLTVERADPTASLEIGDIGFDPEQIELLRPYLPVPVGLALGGAKDAPHRINLLPEAERRVLDPGRVVAIGAAAAVVVLAALGLLTVQRNQALDDARSDLAEQQAVNRQLQAEIDDLQSAQALQTEVDEARGRLASTLATDVSWSRMLQEVARVIPGDVWLDSFDGNVQAAAEAGAPVAGSVSVSAVGDDFPSAAAWLQRVATLPSFANTWVSDITRGTTSVGPLPELETVTFSSSASLTDEARSARSRDAQEEAGAETFEPPADEQPAGEEVDG